MSAGSDEDWKKTVGVKRRGMERRCESQWGRMVEEAEERVKTRWKQPKRGDEQGSHHSCFLFKIPSRCAPHLSPELNAGWLTHYYRSVWSRPLRGSLFCWGRAHEIRSCVQMCGDPTETEPSQSSSALPARSEAKETHPCMLKSSFRSVWRQKKAAK